MNKFSFLFYQFFRIALFVVGGGLAMLPVIEQVFVKHYSLLSEDDFTEMIAMTQTIPGLIAINSAIFVGYKVAGVLGALVAVFGVLLPSLVIVLTLAYFFPLLDMQNKFLVLAFDSVRASVAGVFVVMFIRIFKKTVINKCAFFIVVLLTATFFLKLKTGVIIALALVFGILYKYVEQKKECICSGE